MNTRWLASIAVVIALSAGSAHASCSKDAAPSIPDGKAATSADMTAAQTSVKAYVANGDAYLACLQQALDAEATPVEEKAALTAQYNAAVDEMQGVAASWKAAITAYKSK